MGLPAVDTDAPVRGRLRISDITAILTSAATSVLHTRLTTAHPLIEGPAFR